MEKETIILNHTENDCPWEGCINSVNYRIERGVAVEVPAMLAEIIRRSEAEQIANKNRYNAFTSANGKRL